MDVMAAANAREAEGRRVIHMEVGQPGAPAPRAVLDEARLALAHGRFGYTEAKGLPVLREAISTHYAGSYGIDVPADRIVATTGSSAGFNLAFLAAFDPGDRVALTAPGYPAYRNILAALGLEAVEIEVGPETRWALTPELLEAAHRQKPLKGVLVASPANPTGTMMTPDALKALAQACEGLGIWFISDEIYHGLVFAGEQETALRHSDKAIIINSFSKYYCMTGWRIGWMILPEMLLRPVERLAQSLYISAPYVSQIAATGAFSATDELEAVKQGYAANRATLLEKLPQIGFDELLPVDGAFYVYASVRRFSNDSHDFATRMLRETGIAATPGADFDRDRGHRYVRFSFAGNHQDMVDAMDLLSDWLK
ncbi:aminotransferase class I/II-fold pyridoxal phosphate-dependent enzyme [Rhizobiales bacterium]|nr:aminotransferase class I/II-fold pyridoxal phosphate-dependent enzyme [Hongsoonwoonella zoysiae]